MPELLTRPWAAVLEGQLLGRRRRIARAPARASGRRGWVWGDRRDLLPAGGIERTLGDPRSGRAAGARQLIGVGPRLAARARAGRAVGGAAAAPLAPPRASASRRRAVRARAANARKMPHSMPTVAVSAGCPRPGCRAPGRRSAAPPSRRRASRSCRRRRADGSRAARRARTASPARPRDEQDRGLDERERRRRR